MSTEAIDALLVRNLLDLERASNRMTGEIEPKVGELIDKIITTWADEQTDWFVDIGFNDGYTEIAPESWRIPDSERSENKFLAEFRTDANDVSQNENSWTSHFWLAQLCGLSDGPVGFRWVCDFAALGTNKSGWKRFLSKIDAPAAAKGFGFEYQDKSGTFFLPFSIDKELLAKAIEENNIEDSLEPVRAALKIILDSWTVFDGFIKEFKKT
jgi:hypothetical protein